MLEETLTSPNHPPAEVAQMLMNYVNSELAAGGASAEARFFQLFSLLCQRVYGPISPKDQKHLIGGWLAKTVRWDRPRVLAKSSLAGGPRKYTQTTSIQSDPVVKLLGVPPKASSSREKGPLTLIEAFAKEAEHRPNVRYQFPFLGLPKAIQEDWLAMVQIALGGVAPNGKPSENSIRLMGSLFRVKLLDQKQLLTHLQSKIQKKDHRRPLQFSPIYSPTPKSPSPGMMSSPVKQNEKASPDVLLSMLEYYLVMFIRYPLASPEIKNTSYSSRKTEIYGESVYFELFQQYANYYIRTRVPQGAFNGFTSPHRPSEMFVRTIIAFWLEGQNQTASTFDSTKLLQDRRGYTSFDLNSSFDLVYTKFKPLPSQIVRCIHKVVNRIVSDGAIADLAKDLTEGYKGPNPDILCMSPIMTILQQPFYNHIRNVFRYASLHNNPNMFYSAFNDWLVWLEPWNTEYPVRRTNFNSMSRSNNDKNSRSTQVVYPKANQRSKYKPYWEGYIASNLHFYIVPFAIFLRRSRELDFSPALYQKSLNIVKRVLRVYTPEVVSVINRLLKERNAMGAPTSKFGVMVKNHEKNLGPFAPPSNPLSLASCQEDMKNLLEEISLQHIKKVESLDIFSRTFASLLGTGAYMGEEKELNHLLNTAKAVVGFAKDYEVVPKDRKHNSSNPYDTNYNFQDRTAEGSFSTAGHTKVVNGAIKCNPEDIVFMGDRMNAIVQSHEIPILVHQLVKLSNFLNAYFGLDDASQDPDSDASSLLPRRINLRYFADYRNLIFLFLVFYFFF
eukprot:CAMPEP_0116148056 /NCGR_PEP_ID=MMETSP0329-20121206/18122_1 /TAXON_ID=697910 /ORGANISM="Pseudo-nitzschia arenysensis, Strain B593" /LENGTH=782 /DNA_ID=CAMNT_0003644101 /DNA_START=194 /DNA_END=2542 /DNA_ORIENTATION=-